MNAVSKSQRDTDKIETILAEAEASDFQPAQDAAAQIRNAVGDLIAVLRVASEERALREQVAAAHAQLNFALRTLDDFRATNGVAVATDDSESSALIEHVPATPDDDAEPDEHPLRLPARAQPTNTQVREWARRNPGALKKLGLEKPADVGRIAEAVKDACAAAMAKAATA
jgi:hypothetical protein